MDIDFERLRMDLINYFEGAYFAGGIGYAILDADRARYATEDELITDNIEIMRNGTVIISDQKDGLFIKTKNGILKVLEIQGENAKKMSIGDFLRGNQIQEFDVFE